MSEQTPNPLSRFLEEVASPEDKILFQEAVDAAAGGAYRAAYIMTWLSCAESLKRRFSELATRDNTAQKVTTRLSDMESQQRAIDKILLDEAKRYGLIKDSESVELEHVYAMRCVYGHPYEERPAIEALVAAARAVVDIVLSRPTKLRYGYLTEQVQLIMEDRSFLDDLQEPVQRYAQEVFPKVDDSLHFWFMRRLWERTETIAADASMGMFVRRGVWFTVAYLSHLPQESIRTWEVVSDLSKYPTALTQCAASPGLFAQASNHARDIIVGNLLRASESRGDHLRMLERLHDSGALTARQTERYVLTVKGSELSYLAAAGISPRYYAESIVAELKSHNWYRQNPAAAALLNVGSNRIGTLDRETQLTLGNNVLQAADGGSKGAITLLDVIADSQVEWPEAFVEGILIECAINDANEIRFKTGRAKQAIRALSVVSPESAQRIIDQLIERLSVGSIKEGWGRADERTEMLAVLAEYVQDSRPYSSTVQQLASAIATLDIPPDE
ncbi:MAG: hypothetical protein ACYC3S_15435 [Chloroflexota bacterium]